MNLCKSIDVITSRITSAMRAEPSITLVRIREHLEELRQLYDEFEPGPWALVRTKFHGGGVVSRHRFPHVAVYKMMRRRAGTDCACGCVGVVPVSKLDALPTVAECHAPAMLAR